VVISATAVSLLGVAITLFPFPFFAVPIGLAQKVLRVCSKGFERPFEQPDDDAQKVSAAVS
jgi:hypothetical protein